MANIVLPVVGGAVGFVLGGPAGAMIGANIGAMAGGAFAKSQRIKLPTQEGPRLAELRAQVSTYGNVIPRLYGTIRLAGNVIWSTDIKEVRSEHTTHHSSGGGKGGGGRRSTVSQTTVSYSYYVTLAIAICEGEIDEVIRVWADSMVLTQNVLAANHGRYNVHLGTENQSPDDIIAKYKPSGTFPAYRGIAYVVIEDFPLAEFGNRIPNFTFEVRRSVRFKPSVEDKIKEIVMIPGSGEFVYSCHVVQKQEGVKVAGGKKFLPVGKRKSINMHNYEGKADVLLAVDQLLKTLPNIEWVALVVTWFATSTNAGNCRIVPKVEFHGNTKILPADWAVSGHTRETAEEVLRFNKDTPTYGGTPSDNSVLEIIRELKSRNIKVMLYPMIFVDEIKPAAKPWRGRIIPSNSNDANSWFTKNNGYNRFIIHYANLTKDLVDGFIIGSELVGMTSFSDRLGHYPAVNQLVNLAATIKKIVGTTKVIYAADWSEYHSHEACYNLDPLWASSNIDIVGIDSYFPLTEDLPQAQITEDKIIEAWEKGEGWDYYCDHERNRIIYPDAIHAWKNLEHWWSNHHTNLDGSKTAWQPKMKPVWFTELGFPSVDGCANQPNVFYDPSSRESFFPRASRGRINFQAQREALNASLDYLQTRNKTEGKSDLVPKTFLWCWDARPFSFWPDLEGVWQDSRLWATGHWLNGKLGNSTLGAIVSELLELSGLKKDDFDVTRLTDTVEGYVITQPITVRGALEQLACSYFFDLLESDGILKCVPRAKHLDTESENLSLTEEDLVPTDKNGIAETIEIVRAQDLELPNQVNVTYIDRPFNYDPVTQSSQRQTVKAVEQVTLNLPIVMSATYAKKIADVILYGAWKERVSFGFMLPPKYARLEPTDIITVVTEDNQARVAHQMRIIKTDMERNGLMKVAAVAEDVSSYDFNSTAGRIKNNLEPEDVIANTWLELLDLPPLPVDQGNQAYLRIAVSGDTNNWNGAAIYSSIDGGEKGGNSFAPLTGIDTPACLGATITNLEPGSFATWDESNKLEVVIISGQLINISELAVLNGANSALVGDELIQFQYAELIGEQTYRLSRLLRGRQGTEYAINHHQSGERFVLLSPALHTASMSTNMIGRAAHYKAVTVGSSIENTEEQEFTYKANCLKPFAPAHVTGTRDKDGNLTIDWIRRARVDNDWRDNVDVPLGEETEKYQIEIIADDAVVRILETSTPTIIYTAQQQIADFKQLQTQVTIKIYQLSSLVGRGYPAITTI